MRPRESGTTNRLHGNRRKAGKSLSEREIQESDQGHYLIDLFILEGRADRLFNYG